MHPALALRRLLLVTALLGRALLLLATLLLLLLAVASLGLLSARLPRGITLLLHLQATPLRLLTALLVPVLLLGLLALRVITCLPAVHASRCGGGRHLLAASSGGIATARRPA
jgi:hypothetical protein